VQEGAASSIKIMKNFFNSFRFSKKTIARLSLPFVVLWLIFQPINSYASTSLFAVNPANNAALQAAKAIAAAATGTSAGATSMAAAVATAATVGVIDVFGLSP
jgi:hypothetical protein